MRYGYGINLFNWWKSSKDDEFAIQFFNLWLYIKEVSPERPTWRLEIGIIIYGIGFCVYLKSV